MDSAEQLRELEEEPLGEVDALLDRVSKSRQATESVIMESVQITDGPAYLNVSFDAHAGLIRETLTTVFADDSTLNNQEKGALVSMILTEDDAKRVEFMASLTGEEQSGMFTARYVEYGKNADAIA